MINTFVKIAYFLIFLAGVARPATAQLVITKKGIDSLSCYDHDLGIISLVIAGGVAPYSYLWDDGSTASTRSNLKKGTYFCTITDSSIPSLERRDSFKIYAPPPPIINYTHASWHCPTRSHLINIDSFSNFYGPFHGIVSLQNNGKDTIWDKSASGPPPYPNSYSPFNNDSAFFYINESFILRDRNNCKLAVLVKTDSNLRNYIRADFEVYPFQNDTLIEYGSSIRLGIDLLNYPDPSKLTIQWFNDQGLINCKNCTSIKVKPLATTTYKVTVVNPEYGCVTDHVFVVRVKDPPPILYPPGSAYIPNIFTPDYNGYNDYFLPAFNESIEKIKKMVVFNRWGGTVFEKSDFVPLSEKDGWDGKQNGRRSEPGIYLYQIEVLWKDKTTQTFSGDVYLMHGQD